MHQECACVVGTYTRSDYTRFDSSDAPTHTADEHQTNFTC